MTPSGEVPVERLFAGQHGASGATDKRLEGIAFLTCRGGWLEAAGRSEGVALRQAFDHVDGTLAADFTKVGGIRRDRERMARTMRPYARNTAAQASYQTIRAGIAANDAESVEDLMGDLKTFGLFFESIYATTASSWHRSLRSRSLPRTKADIETHREASVWCLLDRPSGFTSFLPFTQTLRRGSKTPVSRNRGSLRVRPTRYQDEHIAKSCSSRRGFARRDAWAGVMGAHGKRGGLFGRARGRACHRHSESL